MRRRFRGDYDRISCGLLADVVFVSARRPTGGTYSPRLWPLLPTRQAERAASYRTCRMSQAALGHGNFRPVTPYSTAHIPIAVLPEKDARSQEVVATA